MVVFWLDIKWVVAVQKGKEKEKVIPEHKHRSLHIR